MLLLTSTSSSLEIITGSSGSINVQASYIDLSGTALTPGALNTLITTATTTTIVGGPSVGARALKNLCVFNAGAGNNITIEHFDGTSTITVFEYDLQAGEAIYFSEGRGFYAQDADGNLKTKGYVTALSFSNITDGTNPSAVMGVSDSAIIELDPTTPGTIEANYLWHEPIANTAPTDGQVLTYNASIGVWEPDTAAATTEFQVNGADTSSQSLVNFESGTDITVSNPSAGNIKFDFIGQLAQTIAAVTHEFLTSYTSSTGAFTQAALVSGDIPNLPASIITTGQLALARGGTDSDLSATGGTSQVLRQSSTGAAITVSQLAYSDISSPPQLAQTIAAVTHEFLTSYTASTGLFTLAQPAFTDISGTASLTQGGTNANLSATGAAHSFLKQVSSGAALTVGLIASGDIPSGVVTWDLIGSAGANLTLANAAFTTTFNQTSAVVWAWANITAATAAGANASSPIQELIGTYFTSGATANDSWAMQNSIAAATACTTVSNATENSSSLVTLVVSGNTLPAGASVTLSSFANFTWLNLQNVTLTTSTATSITFTDPTSHGTQASHAETGSLTQNNPSSTFALTHSGSSGVASVNLPANSPTTSGSWSLSFGSSPTFGLTSNGAFLALNTNSSSLYPGLRFFSAGALETSLTLTSSGGILIYSLQSETQNASCVQLAGLTKTNVFPAVIIGGNAANNGSFTATSGTQLGVSIGNQSVTAGNGQLTFAPASGSASFIACLVTPTINQTSTASGSYIALAVQAKETALLGTANKLLSLQAGSAGTTVKFEVNNSGVVNSYLGISTVGSGVCPLLAKVDLTGQVAAVSNGTALYSVPAGMGGLYRVSCYAKITTASDGSSTLGGTGGFTLTFTDPTDSTTPTAVTFSDISSQSLTGNTTTTIYSTSALVSCAASTNLQYGFGYTNTSVSTAMAYKLSLKVEYVG